MNSTSNLIEGWRFTKLILWFKNKVDNMEKVEKCQNLLSM